MTGFRHQTVQLPARRGRALSRRAFVAGGALGLASVAGGLAGCSSWTPRSEVVDGTVPDEVASNDSAAQEALVLDDGLILIEGGAFSMGSPDDEGWSGGDELLHEVQVSSFYLSPYEVTRDEYAQVMGSAPTPEGLEGVGGEVAVSGVTWLEAVAFCNALSESAGLDPVYTIDGDSVSWDRTANGYRLPTEAEWEYACRAGTTTPFSLEPSPSADTDANYYGTYPYGIEQNYFAQSQLEVQPGVYRQEPIAPGSFAANPWGLYDMHGNVAEWVWDYYGPYTASSEARVDPTGPDQGGMRVNRGGGWNDFAKNLRSAYRASLPPDGSSPSVGLRVARNASAGVGVVAAAGASGGSQPGDVLIAYFSWGGNTRFIAQRIAEQTGADVVELELEEPYSTDYSTVLDEAQRDQAAQARPALATTVEGMGHYGTVLLGYPNWWASIPMPIASFLESYDFAGKRIVPFCSHGGGRLGQSITAIAKLAPQAILGTPLSVHYQGGSSLDADIAYWLTSNGLEGGA